MNIGVIGYGMMAKMLMDSMKNVEGYNIIAIGGLPRGEERLKKIKEDYNLEYYTTDYHDLLNDDNIDAIYVASPNDTHYQYGLDILNAGKHCLMEKPFSSFKDEVQTLVNLANEKGLILFEAITNQHIPTLNFTREHLKDIGEMRLGILSFCKNSSRYERFKQGDIAPVFDINQHGGALGDLNVYNIHLALALFGAPKDVNYHANIDNGVDTSGILTLSYDTFQIVCLAGKDCNGPFMVNLQGDEGFISSEYQASIYRHVTINPNKGEKLEMTSEMDDHYYYELAEFKRLVEEKDLLKANEYLEHDLRVMDVLEKARESANIIFKR